MSPWELLAWAVAVSVSMVVATLGLVVVIAGLKALRRASVRRRTIDG